MLEAQQICEVTSAISRSRWHHLLRACPWVRVQPSDSCGRWLNGRLYLKGCDGSRLAVQASHLICDFGACS